MAGRIIHSSANPNVVHKLEVRKVNGKPGKFTSLATYCEPAAVCTGWSHSSICPGPKSTKLSKKGTHVIHVVISFDQQTADECEVISHLQTNNGLESLKRRLKNNSSGTDHVEIRMNIA